jgi:hypothetical protein
MNRFDQFDIKTPIKGFEGDKIRIAKILGKEIIVHDFRIEESKVDSFKARGAAQCLYLQISFNGEKHIVFTSSIGLLYAIQQIPETGFPFITTIIEENDRFRFT